MSREDDHPDMNEPDFLIESIPNVAHAQAPHHEINPWPAVLFSLLVSLAAGVLCQIAAGATLGLFLGGLLLAGLLTAPIVAGESGWLARSLAVFGVIHGFAAVWLYAAIQIDLDFGMLAACYLVLATWVLAIAGVTSLFAKWGMGFFGAAIASLLAVAWLTWPIWLSGQLHGTRGEQLAAWLVPANPIFATNAILRARLGYWLENGIAYRISSLQNNVAYGLPETALRCILLHLGIAACCVILTLIGRKRPVGAEDRKE